MFDLEWLGRLMLGQHVMQRELRNTAYRLSPDYALLRSKGSDLCRWSMEDEVTAVARLAFLLPAEGDPHTRWKSIRDMMDKKTLRQMEINSRWVEGRQCFVWRSSIADFLLMTYCVVFPRSYDKEHPIPPLELPGDSSFEDDDAGYQVHNGDGESELGYYDQQLTEDGSIGLRVRWLHMGGPASVLEGANARGAVANWQVCLETAFRDAGFSIRTFSDRFQ
jgi:hypothetical protein